MLLPRKMLHLIHTAISNKDVPEQSRKVENKYGKLVGNLQ